MVLQFDHDLHYWLLLLSKSKKSPGVRGLKGNRRARIATWAANIFISKSDFDTIVRVLVGDDYFDKHKKDIAKLEKEAGRSVMDLWDTDPIFSKYPKLRSLARNVEFEKMWAKMKQNVK